MTKLAIHVFMYPHDSRPTSFQQFSWHRPANIKLRFRPAGGGASVVLVTDRNGVARGDLPKGKGYTIGLPDLTSSARSQEFFYLLKLPAATITKPNRPARIAVGKAPKTVQLHIFPAKGNWLVPLWLKLGTATGPKPTGVANAKVDVTDAGGSKSFTSLSDGHVFATAGAGDVTVQPAMFPNLAPVPAEFIMQAGQEQEAAEVEYRPTRARITVTPRLKSGEAIPSVTFELSRPGQGKPLSQVSQGSQACVFDDLMPSQVTVKVTPPAQFNGSPIALIGQTDCVSVSLAAGDDLDLSKRFQFKYTTGRISGRIVNGEDQPIPGISIVATSNGQSKSVKSGKNGKYTIRKLRAGQWTLMLAQSTVRYGGETLYTQQSQQDLTVQAGKTAKATDFKLEPDEHGIRGQVTDSSGMPFPNAIVEIRDQRMQVIDTVVTDDQGNYSWQSPSSGMFVVNLLTRDGRTVQREAVTVNSWTSVNMRAPDSPDGSGTQASGGNGSGNNQSGRSAPSGGPGGGEAVTDLSAYPVLTEEISTTGVPAPSGGGGFGGGTGAGYGQVVDQVIRDVLGWRPGGDLAGFQAALTGAFQLREMEGHTEWTWQQRGYAVQADMGALTGAQASIYARAKAALDQIQPMLAGLTTLNPATYEPQDLETIRSVVGTELQELVSELALEGGPRIQRVDELFRLLLGEGRKDLSMDPDLVQGNLGTLRQRFALTTDEIQTVDEERIVTNFRIIVEQVLALYASWRFDRKLLSGVGPKAALGTILIWLSRGLEAVCESVGDLMFALDSVFVDAAQRQVIELRFGGLNVDVPEVPFKGNPPQTVTEQLEKQAPMFLSDLLDWVLRVSRDEGPRIIQDAGKDGVLAFKPVLNTLRVLVRATAKIAHEQSTQNAMPAGMRTPRVDRAIKVLAAQLDEAANLASLVRVELVPQITFASIVDPFNQQPISTTALHTLSQIEIVMTGSNFRGPAKGILAAEQNEDLDELRANVTINTPSTASAIFNNPNLDPANAGTTWVVSIINNDETQSVPIEVLRVPR